MDLNDPSAWHTLNAWAIDEFRNADGHPKGPWEFKKVLLLTYTGRNSGIQRTIPLVYFTVSERVFVMAAKGGYAHDPEWLASVREHPKVTLTIGTAEQNATVRILDEPDRTEIYEMIADSDTRSAQSLTTRLFPVLELMGAVAA
jgi:deazaflavin-dependent oxidoreductase (nitroreductase family)